MKKVNPFIHNPSAVFERVENLSVEEREQESELLRDALTYHNYLRTILKEPEIPEETYFALRSRLSRLEEYRASVMLSRGMKPDIR